MENIVWGLHQIFTYHKSPSAFCVPVHYSIDIHTACPKNLQTCSSDSVAAKRSLLYIQVEVFMYLFGSEKMHCQNHFSSKINCKKKRWKFVSGIRNINFGLTHIHRCVLALYIQDFLSSVNKITCHQGEIRTHDLCINRDKEFKFWLYPYRPMCVSTVYSVVS